MLLIPVHTPLLHPGDDIAAMIGDAGMQKDDIIVVSSKAIATIENRFIDLKERKPSVEAKKWAARTGRSPEFRQAVLDEVERMHGRVLSSPANVMLTEVKPDGLSKGVILTANAGLDESNAPEGQAIGWPVDPVMSVRSLRMQLEQSFADHREPLAASANGERPTLHDRIAVIITDSCCRPRRLGVTAFALAVSGFDPMHSLVGTKDLFGRELRMTQEAVADQLATAANMLMGNAAASVPAVIIRDHRIPFSDFEGWVPGIEPKEDLFQGIF